MTNNDSYGRRKDDIMLPELSPEIIASLSDTQRTNLRIIQSLSSINNTISSLNTTLQDIKNEVAEHDKILVTGNGVPSMQERMRTLEAFMETMKYWGRFIGGAIVLQTLGFAVATVIAVVRVLPLIEKLAATP